MTIILEESTAGFGEMSFADPHFDACVSSGRKRISKVLLSPPRGADFEMDPHIYLEDVQEEGEQIEIEKVKVKDKERHREIDLDDFAPPPLTCLSSPETSPDGPQSPRKVIRAGTRSAASKSPLARARARGSRREELQGDRQSSRRRIHSSPQHRSSRRNLQQEQSTHNFVSSSHRRLLEPSRNTHLMVSSELPGVYSSHANSNANTNANASSPSSHRTSTSDEDQITSPRKSSHPRRSTTTNNRPSSRRNLLAPPVPDLRSPIPQKTTGTINRKTLDRSTSDNVEVLKSAAASTSTRLLVPPSKSDTPTGTYVSVRHGVIRSSSEGSNNKPSPSTSRRDLAQAALAIQKHQIISPSSKASRRNSQCRSKSPSHSRRKTPRSYTKDEEPSRTQEPNSSSEKDRSRSEHKNTRTDIRSKSRERRAGDGSRRGRTTTSCPSNEKQRSRSKSREASSRRHCLRATGARHSKSNEKEDALTLLYSVLGTDTGNTSNKLPVRNNMVEDTAQASRVLDLSSYANRRPSPGVTFSPDSRYILSHQAYKDKKEESKARRSNIMKSLKDLLQFDADNLKVEIQEDGTKRLVIELGDLNTVMEDLENNKR